jgi:hypothetical protein
MPSFEFHQTIRGEARVCSIPIDGEGRRQLSHQEIEEKWVVNTRPLGPTFKLSSHIEIQFRAQTILLTTPLVHLNP